MTARLRNTPLHETHLALDATMTDFAGWSMPLRYLMGATMTIPADLRYTRDHEWLRTDGDTATVGITAFAAAALGDVVFVGPPSVGDTLCAGQACGEIESTKSVSDLNAPAGGEVVEINNSLGEDPGLVNSDPYGSGWLFRVRVDGPLGDLLDATAYAALIEEV